MTKGILKNSSEHSAIDTRPSPDLTERELAQLNAQINAGQRRNSSKARSLSRRQSGGSSGVDAQSPAIKWDEANLYLNEGERGGKMPINEPKTPYAARYDPAEDEDDDEAVGAALDADQIAVDELDMSKDAAAAKARRVKADDIPGLDLGEPEMDTTAEHNGEKRVIVDPEVSDADGGRHGEDEANMNEEEREKHHKFEMMRKRHYEMKNVKDLLGHAEEDGED